MFKLIKLTILVIVLAGFAGWAIVRHRQKVDKALDWTQDRVTEIADSGKADQPAEGVKKEAQVPETKVPATETVNEKNEKISLPSKAIDYVKKAFAKGNTPASKPAVPAEAKSSTDVAKSSPKADQAKALEAKEKATEEALEAELEDLMDVYKDIKFGTSK